MIEKQMIKGVRREKPLKPRPCPGRTARGKPARASLRRLGLTKENLHAGYNNDKAPAAIIQGETGRPLSPEAMKRGNGKKRSGELEKRRPGELIERRGG
jgi:hypothetical protein